jgi:hypothetical protein
MTGVPSPTEDLAALREALRLLADEDAAVRRLALLRRAAEELRAGVPQLNAIDLGRLPRSGRGSASTDTLLRALATIDAHIGTLLARSDGFTANAVRSDPCWAEIRRAARVAMAGLAPTA